MAPIIARDTAEADLDTLLLQLLGSSETELKQTVAGGAVIYAFLYACVCMQAGDYFFHSGSRDGLWRWLFVYVVAGLTFQLGCYLWSLFLVLAHDDSYFEILATDTRLTCWAFLVAFIGPVPVCLSHFSNNATKLWEGSKLVAVFLYGLTALSAISGVVCMAKSLAFPYPTHPSVISVMQTAPAMQLWWTDVKILNAVWMGTTVAACTCICACIGIGLWRTRTGADWPQGINLVVKLLMRGLFECMIPPLMTVLLLSGYVLSGHAFITPVRTIFPLVPSSFAIATFHQLAQRDVIKSRLMEVTPPEDLQPYYGPGSMEMSQVARNVNPTATQTSFIGAHLRGQMSRDLKWGDLGSHEGAIDEADEAEVSWTKSAVEITQPPVLVLRTSQDYSSLSWTRQ